MVLLPVRGYAIGRTRELVPLDRGPGKNFTLRSLTARKQIPPLGNAGSSTGHYTGCSSSRNVLSAVTTVQGIDAIPETDRDAFSHGHGQRLTNGQMLEQFLGHRGDDAEAAFAALVDQHGAMVLRVCRQVLRGEEDAEGAREAGVPGPGSSSQLNQPPRGRSGAGCTASRSGSQAKARATASHHRAHELRGGEMRTSGRVVDADLGAVENA